MSREGRGWCDGCGVKVGCEGVCVGESIICPECGRGVLVTESWTYVPEGGGSEGEVDREWDGEWEAEVWEGAVEWREW